MGEGREITEGGVHRFILAMESLIHLTQQPIITLIVIKFAKPLKNSAIALVTRPNSTTAEQTLKFKRTIHRAQRGGTSG